MQLFVGKKGGLPRQLHLVRLLQHFIHRIGVASRCLIIEPVFWYICSNVYTTHGEKEPGDFGFISPDQFRLETVTIAGVSGFYVLEWDSLRIEGNPFDQ